MPVPGRAFISYQTDDRAVAGEIGAFLESIHVQPFLAHETIEASHEWQQAILLELGRTDLFFAVLSQRFCNSAYCLQESGIALSRGITIVPLSIDGTLPPGFLASIQSRRIEPGNINRSTLFEGIAKYDFDYAFDMMLNRLGVSGSYASAEHNYGVIRPFLSRANQGQISEVLHAAALNNQISFARGCKPHLQELFEDYGHELDEQDRTQLQDVLYR